jgi:hypothetical protein
LKPSFFRPSLPVNSSLLLPVKTTTLVESEEGEALTAVF